jgi:protein-tyrosine phosphatase
MDDMQEIHVMFLCLGNICRSPLAEGMFRRWAAEQDQVAYRIDSAGTGSWHVGKPPHRGSVRIARSNGIDLTDQRAQQLAPWHFEEFDFIVAMDASNRRNAKRVGQFPDDRLILLREFDPQPEDGNVPDPYGGGAGGFEGVFQIIERSIPGLCEYMRNLGPR